VSSAVHAWKEQVTMSSADEVRAAQRTTWAGLAAGWEKWDEIIMDQLAPVSAAMIDRLGITEDHRHLDVAAGTGEPGLSIARLAPRGRVVLTDLAQEMLHIASRRAVARGIANIDTTACSADDLPFADATFDSVSVRFGYMFFPDLAKATAEFTRVLRPGGRLCASVWTEPEANPWATIVTHAIAPAAVVRPTDPDSPNMFRCAAERCIGSLYEGAGLCDVAEWDVAVELETRSPAQYWEMISEHVSLAVAALRHIDGASRDRIRATAIERVSAFEQDGTVRVPGVARCIVGRKQHADGTAMRR
jgi:ubiquinone/menaquinone biosynthesis C-methylase UbiE